MFLTLFATVTVFALALLALSLGALLGGKRLRKSCGDVEGACVCAHPCERRARLLRDSGASS